MAILLTTDGASEVVAPQDGPSFQLQELYRLLQVRVIEIHPLNDNMVMVCDEEGKLKDAPQFNLGGTIMYQACYGDCDEIYGNVLICRSEEVR